MKTWWTIKNSFRQIFVCFFVCLCVCIFVCLFILSATWGDSLINAVFITAFCFFQLQCYWKSCNEVESLKFAETSVGFEPVIFQFYYNVLNLQRLVSTNRSYIFKKTCSWKLQVCLSIYYKLQHSWSWFRRQPFSKNSYQALKKQYVTLRSLINGCNQLR